MSKEIGNKAITTSLRLIAGELRRKINETEQNNKKCDVNITEMLQKLKECLSKTIISWNGLVEILDKRTIWALAEFIDNEKCGKEVTDLFILIGKRYKDSGTLIISITENMLCNMKTTRAVPCLFSISCMLLYCGYLTRIEMYFYHDFILPNLIVPADVSISLIIVESFSKLNFSFQLETCRWICKMLKQCESMNYQRLLAILSEVISVFNSNTHNKEDNTKIVEHFNEAITVSLGSENHLVIDSVSALFEMENIRIFIETYLDLIVPEIFPVLYKRSKIFWRAEQRCQLLEILRYVLECDPELFEETLVKYNIEKTIKECKVNYKEDSNNTEN